MRRLLALCLVLAGCSAPSATRRGDHYAGVAKLRASEREGRDFVVTVLDRRSPVAVFAIHGGEIEPGTSPVARAVAGEDWSLYLFEGLRPGRGRRLHVTATRFDDPAALALAGGADLGVSVHGSRGKTEPVCVGGGHAGLRRRTGELLAQAGFAVREPCPDLPGSDPANIANRPRFGGIQLELSAGLREALARDPERLRRLVGAVRAAALEALASRD